MNIPRLLQSPLLRRREFPITATKVFLAHAATSPFPRRVSAAIRQYAGGAASQGQWEYLYSTIENETREYAARLIGAHRDEIAFISSTSMGLGLVAAGLPWKDGENVVVADGDFPSNVYPWMNLKYRGVETRFIPRRRDGSVTVEDLESIVDRNTRLVSLSSVNFVTGFRIDLDEIGDYLHDRGIYFCVDAVQSLGAYPVSVRNVDFLAASSHKWLMGPLGVGTLYIKRDHFEKVRPVLAGWKSMKGSKQYLDYNLDFMVNAQRYEPGVLNILGIVGLHAALRLILEVGVDRIGTILDGHRVLLAPALEKKGYEIVSPQGPGMVSGITSFMADRRDIGALREDLDRAGYVVSLRENFTGGKCIRVAPHFYNTREELLRFLEAIPSIY